MFNLPNDSTYLNCAYMGPLHHDVEAAAKSALARQRNPCDVPPAEYFDAPDRVRAGFSKLVHGAGPQHVALVPSVSYAMTTAAYNCHPTATQNIVVIANEFPSAVLPWKLLSEKVGCELRTAKPADAFGGRYQSWNESILDCIDSATAAVIVSPLHWEDGTLFDLPSICARAHNAGAMICIDATQAAGALALNVQSLQPDVLVAAGYKWLLGGYGMAVMYCSSKAMGWTPVDRVWTSMHGSNDFTYLTNYTQELRDDASRLDGGERASFVLTGMLAASLKVLTELRIETIVEHCNFITSGLDSELAALGLYMSSSGQRAPHLFGIRSYQHWNAAQMAKELAVMNISVSCRGDVLRVSPHIYNSAEHIQRLVDGLGSLRQD